MVIDGQNGQERVWRDAGASFVIRGGLSVEVVKTLGNKGN
jgi:hypothetical protein